jgi:hypothetical protein
MINLDKLIEKARLTKLEAEVDAYRAVIKRREGNTWLADMLEMDSKFAAEETAVLLGKILLIALRTVEIAEFERSTGVQFDSLDMDVPHKKHVATWINRHGDVTFSQEN